MFTLLDANFFFPNRSGTTQEGSQGLWDYPQPIPDASFPTPKTVSKDQFFFFESGTSNHYYQVKASSIFVAPRSKMATKW